MQKRIAYTICIFGILIGAGISMVKWINNINDHRDTLHIYNWSDYIDPELIAAFEVENNCIVVVDTFDDNETMLAKLMSGATGYDIIFPSSYVIPVLKRNNLIQQLDMEKLPNVVSNFDGKYNNVLHEDTFQYSVPYAFSLTGIAFRSDKCNVKAYKEWPNLGEDNVGKNGWDASSGQKAIWGWDFLLTPELNKKICILNDIREMIGIGLKRQGYSVNSNNDKELALACEYAISLKTAARRMDNSEYRVGLANGTFYAAIGYNSDVLQVKQENPDVAIEFFVPSEGSTCCWDEMCITIFSEKAELAHKFINFLYDAKNAAKNIEYVCSIQPNKGMWEYLDEEAKLNPLINIDERTLGRLELIKDVGENICLFNKWWDEFTKTER